MPIMYVDKNGKDLGTNYTIFTNNQLGYIDNTSYTVWIGADNLSEIAHGYNQFGNCSDFKVQTYTTQDETYISSLGSKTFEYFVPTYGANYQKCYNYAHLVCVQTENNN